MSLRQSKGCQMTTASPLAKASPLSDCILRSPLGADTAERYTPNELYSFRPTVAKKAMVDIYNYCMVKYLFLR
jgi:hypothetical protein